MRRAEAIAVVAAGVGFTAAALTWLAGPFGLLGVGLVLLVVALFVVDLEG